MKPIEAILKISQLMDLIYLCVGEAERKDMHPSGDELYNQKWQEISRIAAEQAAKPEIQGFAAHDSSLQQTPNKDN